MTLVEHGAEAWAVRVPTGYRVECWQVTGGIATGSWGSVYEARPIDPRTDQPDRVALKFLPTGTVTPRQLNHLREMAEREVRFHRHGAHERVIRAFRALTVDDPTHPELDGAVVLVMERAERSLADLLHQHRGHPVPGAARLVEQLCEGIAHLHRHGWVHGDLKPSNILLMADGSVRLADFGLAAELEGTHGYLPPVGSSDYVPPERWTERLGDRGLAVRTSADIWALGVTAYELFTGHHPFTGSTTRARALAAAEYAAGTTVLPVPPEVPAAWRALIRNCLAPTHAERRHHDAAALLERIRMADTAPATRRRRRLRAAGAALTVVATTGAFVLLGDASRLTGPVTPPPAAAPSTGTAPITTTPVPSMPVAPADAGLARAPARSSSPTVEYRPDLLRTGVGIPSQYRRMIVAAGTACTVAGLSPALVAAMLKVESDFDANLSDPTLDEYGIARWTPRVLQHYLPEQERAMLPRPPFPPEVSIPAVGRYLCVLGPHLAGVPGEPAPLLAAAYRTSTNSVVEAGGVPPELRAHIERIDHFLTLYRPAAR